METIKRVNGIRYREKIYINGKPQNSPYFTRKSDARAWKRRMIQERDRMLALGLNHNTSVSLSKYFETFLERKSDRARRTLDAYRCIFSNHIERELGTLKLSDIRLLHGEELKQKLVRDKKLKAKRVNNILNFLKIIMNDAVKFDYILTSPFKALEFIKEPPKQMNYWLGYEIEQFLRANRDDYFYPLYVVALNLGLRKGEILGLQCSQVDFDNQQILIDHSMDRYGLKDTTKNSRSRTLAMNSIVSSALKNHLESREIDSKFVFTQENGKPINYSHFTQRVFYKAIERAGVKKITFQECRKSFASNFVMSSGDIYALKNLLGHQSIDVTQKSYAHLHPKFLKEQAEIVQFSGEKRPDSALNLVKEA